MRIALLHYTFPPVVGGVERIVSEHARLFAADGHDVTILTGEGDLPPSVDAPAARWQGAGTLKLKIIPELRGHAPASEAYLLDHLCAALADQDVLIVHNVLTMPFNLPLIAALWRIADELTGLRVVCWIHDVAAANSDYEIAAAPNAPEAPWQLLRQAHPRIEYVAISEVRRREFCAVTGLPDRDCRVLPNGIDLLDRLHLPAAVRRLAEEWHILERDLVLLHPARLLPRKNVELSLRITAALKRIQATSAERFDPLLMLTAPLDPHNAHHAAYASSIQALTAELNLEAHVLFVAPSLDHEFAPPLQEPPDALYQLADAVLLPSHHEGFGLPVLEGALHRVPIFCSDIEPLTTLLPGAVSPFSLRDSPEEIAREILRQISASGPIQGRKAVVRQYAWPVIYRNFLAPLLADSDTRSLRSHL